MRGIPGPTFFIFFFFIVVVELLAFIAIRQLLRNTRIKRIITRLYITLSILLLGVWIVAFINPSKIRETVNYQFFYFVISVTFLNLIPKLIVSTFLVLSYVMRFLKIKFFAKLVLIGGVIISLGVLLSIGWGITFGREGIRIEKQNINVKNLPPGLNGLRIVQLSDIHLGSFQNDRFLSKCATAVNDLKPDLLLFTGDMVNNYYLEMIGFEEELAEMKSKYGKFAILGNHDYGDYSNWKTDAAKLENHEQLCQAIEKAGFRLLLNSAAKLEIADTSLFIIGVENWGHPPFPQYAKLNKAITNVPDGFNILLSHDPTHWEAKVLPETKVPLTLSGHTHAAQTGFRFGGIEFSPMFLIQKYWGGLYEKNGRFLYVNRGLGCVGLLGRIDMKPEITLIRLLSDGIKTN